MFACTAQALEPLELLSTRKLDEDILQAQEAKERSMGSSVADSGSGAKLMMPWMTSLTRVSKRFFWQSVMAEAQDLLEHLAKRL